MQESISAHGWSRMRDGPDRSDKDASEDWKRRVDAVTSALGGNDDALRDLTERHLGTRDLDEADRRTRVIWEWEEENDAE